MRTEQLEHVATVSRLGSVHAAAAALDVSPPALGATIRTLERELGVELLDRRRASPTISDAGRALLPDVLRVLASADRLRRAAGARHRSGDVVRLGLGDVVTAALVAPAVRALRDSRATSRVEAAGAADDALRRGVRHGAFDLGLVALADGDALPDELEADEVVRAAPVALVRAGHPLATRSRVTEDDLLGGPIVTTAAGSPGHRFVHRLPSGRTPPTVHVAADAASVALLAAEGLGVAIVPPWSAVVEPHVRSGALVARPLPDLGPPDALTLLRDRDAPASAAARDLRRLLVEHVGATVRAPHVGHDARAAALR